MSLLKIFNEMGLLDDEDKSTKHKSSKVKSKNAKEPKELKDNAKSKEPIDLFFNELGLIDDAVDNDCKHKSKKSKKVVESVNKPDNNSQCKLKCIIGPRGATGAAGQSGTIGATGSAYSDTCIGIQH